MKLSAKQVQDWIINKELGYNRAYRAAQAFIVISRERDELLDALEKLHDAALAGCLSGTHPAMLDARNVAAKAREILEQPNFISFSRPYLPDDEYLPNATVKHKP